MSRGTRRRRPTNRQLVDLTGIGSGADFKPRLGRVRFDNPHSFINKVNRAVARSRAATGRTKWSGTSGRFNARGRGAILYRDNVTTNTATDYIKAAGMTVARISSAGSGAPTNGSVAYLHQDHLGSANTGTTASGTIAWRENYTPPCRAFSGLN